MASFRGLEGSYAPPGAAPTLKRAGGTNLPVYTVGASEYGKGESGHSCPKGPNDVGGMAFAELNMGTALGNLPCGTQLKIERVQGGKNVSNPSVVATKVDIGLGGGPVEGHARRIDLYYKTAQAIGLSGTGLVRISRVDGHPIIGPGDAKSGAAESAAVPSNIIPNPLEGLGDWTKELAKFLHFITSSSGWVRIGKVVLGAGLLVIALSELTKISPEASTALDPAKKAVGAARKV